MFFRWIIKNCTVDPLGLFDSVRTCTFVLTRLSYNILSCRKLIVRELTLAHRQANEPCLAEMQLNSTHKEDPKQYTFVPTGYEVGSHFLTGSFQHS